ncbi:MAG: phosphatidylglycerophosphatase A [Candidatus Accumulibacter sp.]|jgi:phosphatidylglycerophosphatase A|nr:phosphatidylglycerophosphatase A [Accumulibacter sp.]
MVKIKTSKAPPPRFLFSHPAHLVACGFGSGLSPFAPGTAGTLFAWLSYPLLRGAMADSGLLAFLLICGLGGIFAVQRTGDDLGAVDHGSIVWDEIVPFWLVLFVCPPDWRWQAAAFLAFRFFDVVKPQPARFFDQRVKNGFGVMADDLVAGLYTVLTLAALRYFLNGLDP